MCLDSDGFAMNSLEEDGLGYPVLVGNLVLNPNGLRSLLMGLQLQTYRQDCSSRIDHMPCSTGSAAARGIMKNNCTLNENNSKIMKIIMKIIMKNNYFIDNKCQIIIKIIITIVE
jgi:hypothetical protein